MDLQFENAAGQVLANLKTKVTGSEGQLEEPVPEDVQILLTSREDTTSMRKLGVSLFFFLYVLLLNFSVLAHEKV